MYFYEQNQFYYQLIFLPNLFLKLINCKLEFKNNLKITFDLKLGSLKTKANTFLIL